MTNRPHVIRRLREDRRLTQRELARRAGIDTCTMSRLENGLRPNRVHIEKLAKGLDVTPANLKRAITLSQRG